MPKNAIKLPSFHGTYDGYLKAPFAPIPLDSFLGLILSVPACFVVVVVVTENR